MAEKQRVYNAFGKVPRSVAPSQLVRRWDTALLASIAMFAVFFFLSLMVSRVIAGDTGQTFKNEASTCFNAGIYWLTLGTALKDQYIYMQDAMESSSLFLWRYIGVWIVTLTMFGLTLKATLTPRSNEWVLDGSPYLHKGKDAKNYAKEMTAKMFPNGVDSEWGLWFNEQLKLNVEALNQHVLIYGSTGSGKSIILREILRQLARFMKKSFIYDVKGDFTSYEDFSANEFERPAQSRKEKWQRWYKKKLLIHRTSIAIKKVIYPRPIIISPYDKRSYVWDVAKDVVTDIQIEIFASCFITDEGGGNNKFFSNAGRMVFVGAVRSLIAEKGDTWNWTDLSERLAMTAEQLAPKIESDYIKALPLIKETESQTTANIMATVMAYTKNIDYLANVWPSVGKRRFSMREWCDDNYKGRKQVIVQGGGEESLTNAYIGALMNIGISDLISPKTPDNFNRGVFFVIDELSSCGKLPLKDLTERGRSKGVALIACLQNLTQLQITYGPEYAKIIPSLMGTQIVCQLQMGETRDEVAKMFGTKLVASLAHDPNANVHTDGKQLILPHELSSLGAKKGMFRGPMGFGIDAIVARAGYHPVLLNFPGMPMPTKRETQVPNNWMTKTTVKRRDPLPDKTVDVEVESNGGSMAEVRTSLTKDELLKELDF